MRIGFVSDCVFPWTVGGVERVEHDEMVLLSKRHEVYSFSLRFEGMRRHFKRGGIDYVGVADASANELYTKDGRRSIGLALRFANGLGSGIGKYDLDIVYANSFPYLHLPVLKRYCRRHQAKLVLDVAEVWSKEYWIGYLGRIRGIAAYHYAKSAIRGADAYVANSSTTAMELERLGIERNRITVFAPVIDLRKMPEPRHSRKGRYVLYAGRLIKEKRVDLWVESVVRANELDSSIRGLIIGSGPEESKIRALIRRYPFIEMRGVCRSKRQLYSIIGGAVCMLNMSEREGLSVITIESAAMGTIPLLPSYTPIPKEVRELSLVRKIDDIPKTIVGIAAGRIGYKMDRRRLGRFDVGAVSDEFERIASMAASSHR